LSEKEFDFLRAIRRKNAESQRRKESGLMGHGFWRINLDLNGFSISAIVHEMVARVHFIQKREAFESKRFMTIASSHHYW